MYEIKNTMTFSYSNNLEIISYIGSMIILVSSLYTADKIVETSESSVVCVNRTGVNQ